MLLRKLCCFFSLPAILCLLGICAHAQANVNENASRYIYVDANNGSDGNSGSSGSPFRTIQAAINEANSSNRDGVSVKVIVNPGVYRESVTIGSYRSTGASLTVEAASTGKAVIAGSDVLSNWNDQGNGIYTHAWTANFGACDVPSGWPTNFAEIARRTEMLYVNGKPLTQVMSTSQLKPGTFFASEAGNTVYAYPDSSVDLNNATVETGARPLTLNISGRSNIAIRGLVFRHAASCMNTVGVIVYGSDNILFDSVQALWNNWGGLGFYSTNNLTVQNSVASHNGGLGIMGANDQNALLSSNETDYNNWRGAQAALFDWGMGGTKLMYMRNTTVQNHFSYNNQAQGLWFDTDNKNININNATLSGNVLAGLQLEASQGPIKLLNSDICRNGGGVNMLNAQGVAIQNNNLYDNGGTGNFDAGEIFVAGFANGHGITDWLSGVFTNIFTTGTVISGNTVTNASPGQEIFGTYLQANDFSLFANSVSAWSNTYSDGATTASFSLVNGKKVDLPGWKAAVTSDYGSNWDSSPGSAPGSCAAPTPDYTDFSLGLNREHYTMTGGKAVAKVRVSSFGSGAVNLSVSGLPDGVSASFSDSNVWSGLVTLTFSATSWAGSQTVPVTIWAVSGSRVHSMTFNLAVTPS
jgi:hypothetical protein